MLDKIRAIGRRKILIVSFFLFLALALYEVTRTDNWNKYNKVRFAKQSRVHEDSSARSVPPEFYESHGELGTGKHSVFDDLDRNFSSYESFIHYTRDAKKSYDAFFNKKCRLCS